MPVFNNLLGIARYVPAPLNTLDPLNPPPNTGLLILFGENVSTNTIFYSFSNEFS